MNTPVKLAKKLDSSEFPPTAHSIHSLKITLAIDVLSCVEPRRNPAVTTPTANKGNICLANPYDDNAHSLFSSFRLSNSKMMESEAIPTTIGTSGTNLALAIRASARKTETIVITTPAHTHNGRNFNIRTSDQQSIRARTPVIYHYR